MALTEIFSISPIRHKLYAIGSSLLHRQLHRDRLQRIVEFVAGGGDDLVYYFHASKDFAEDGVGSVQPTGVREVDMALL